MPIMMDKRQEDEVSLGTLRSSSTEMQKSLQSATLYVDLPMSKVQKIKDFLCREF